ncbi:MAG: BtrH N-terminal domain-containing protein [Tannerella sp.]|jgi:hypothetical protein|nr:BtrH N-terminal domain-containing protein [Tannerella sp.]
MELNIEHRTAAHCENGVTASLLRFYGYDYSEPLIFGLSGSLFFVNLPFIKLAGFPVVSFRALPGFIFARVMRILGFRTRQRIFLSKRNAEKKLDSLLDKGFPTGVVVGMYYLPYMPIEYRFHFNAHNLCILGYDKEGYTVSDPIAIEKVKLSRTDMLRARFARGTYPPFGRLYWITAPPKKQPDLNLLVRKAIRKNCFRMLHQPGPVQWVGVNAFRYMGKNIPRFPAKYGNRKAALYLAQIVRMLEEIGTGGAGFRFLYAAFLQEAAGITGIAALNDFSTRMTAIGDQWRVFAADAARICKNRASENVDYQTIGDSLKEIGRQEEAFFTELEKVVKQ